MHGRNEKPSTWFTIWWAAEAFVPRRNAYPESDRIPMLKSELSAADGRLTDITERTSWGSRRHEPPAIVRPARPRQSSTSTTTHTTALSSTDA